MKVYIALYVSYHAEYFTTDVFYDMTEALTFMAGEMVGRIRDNEMDTPSNPYHETYKTIMQEYNVHKWQNALDEFNNWSYYQPYEERKYYCVTTRVVDGTAPIVVFDSVKTASIINPADYPNGCTCTKCNNHNQYAIPNQPDKSFLCHSCKSMAKLFE